MNDPMSILLIEDNHDDRILYRRVLREVFGDRLNIAEEASGEHALEVIKKADPQCVLLDYSLPGRNGIEVLGLIRSQYPHLPVILFTGQGNESVAVRSLKEGAQDYLVKAEIAPDTLRGVIQVAIEKGALKRRTEEQHNALEIFSQALAHDLREPVRTIRSFANAICNGEIEGDARDEYMRHIRDAGVRMSLLIDTVLSYAQIEGMGEVRPEVFSLADAVSSARANLSALFHERGTVVNVGALPDAVGSRIQIIQVLQNLMSNAVSHSPDPVHLNIRAARDGDIVRVIVRDDGPGISPEYQLKIFEPFRRLNRVNEHCGLGLTICKKIIDGHGGKIGCESKLGEGSSFFFTLPGSVVSGAKARHTPNVKAHKLTESMAVANVLLVDDHESDILLARASLLGPRGMRCNFFVAHSGKEGLTMLREHNEKDDGIDLVLLDINMPVMNGFEMLEVVAKEPELRRIPVVMCSGSTLDKDKERARAMGAIGYLTKPVFFADLRALLAHSVGVRLVDQANGPLTLVRVA